MLKIIVSVLLVHILAGCSQEAVQAPADTPAVEPESTASGSNASSAGGAPDVGKVQSVLTKSVGGGVTPGAAINDALKNVVAQVNGTAVSSTSVSLDFYDQVSASLDVETSYGKDSARATAVVEGQAFAQEIITRSNGLVSSFKVLSLLAPAKEGDLYQVEIEASIAKFSAPADSQKVKIVVAPLTAANATFDIGGNSIAADSILPEIRQRIVDALTQTGRFAVLEREFTNELEKELEFIASGNAVNTDFAKLNQAYSADLIWTGAINTLAYNKSVRQLRTSDRTLVGYSGAWSVSQRIINLATRSILQSNTLKGELPSIEPTTLNAGFDEVKTLEQVKDGIVRKATESILLGTFPISVVEIDGNNVVLSQGGQALAENGRYLVYRQGKEIRDPQTGQSLGRMETACCEVVINRITPNLSYGVLENIKIDLKDVEPGGLQLEERLDL